MELPGNTRRASRPRVTAEVDRSLTLEMVQEFRAGH